jgi:hypothetical protein
VGGSGSSVVEGMVLMTAEVLEGGDMLWKEGREEIRIPALPTGTTVRSMRQEGGRSFV